MRKRKRKQYTIEGNYTEGLKARLKQAGISYGALARQAKIDRAHLSRWMNTEMQPRLANVVKLERALEELLK